MACTNQIVITDVQDQNNILPKEFSLEQNYPNPFNPATTIRFSVPKSAKVEIAVFDVLGRKVKELFNDTTPAGSFELKFYAEDLASGLYIYRLKTNDFSISKKMILMK